MMRWIWAGGLVVVVAMSGAIYGWGIGLFYPCGPIDRVLKLSECRILAAFDGGPMETLLALPDGNLLTVFREDGLEPTQPQRLAEIAIGDGSVVREVPLPDLPPDANWMDAALSPDGSSVVASFLDERVALIDQQSGRMLRRFETYYSVAMVGFLDAGHIMLDPGNVSSERPPARLAQVFAIADGRQAADVTGDVTLPLYSRGLGNALSADGAFLAQHLETPADSGVVGIRLADAKFPDWSGSLLVAPLGSWHLVRQIWPTLWFSPDGKFLAAQFDGAAVWGKETAALIIWDVASREMVQRVPTFHADWDSLVWIEGKRQVAATRFNTDARRAEIALIDY